VRLFEMPVLETAEERQDAAREFAFQAGLGLAELVPTDLVGGNLTLVFALSAWLRMSGMEPLGACSSLLALRRALVEASGLDQATEPVPLLAGDPRSALLNLSVYLHGLICRAASCAGSPTVTVVQEALSLLP